MNPAKELIIYGLGFSVYLGGLMFATLTVASLLLGANLLGVSIALLALPFSVVLCHSTYNFIHNGVLGAPKMVFTLLSHIALKTAEKDLSWKLKRRTGQVSLTEH